MSYQFRPQSDYAGESLPEYSEYWQGEVAGKNSDRYVLWLQQSLNKVVRLRVPLVEDGQFGANTRNALWLFRRQAGLKSSGDIVCPDTEQ